MFRQYFFYTGIVLAVVVIAYLLIKQKRSPYFAFLFLLIYSVARIVNQLPGSLGLSLGLIHNWIGHFLIIALIILFLWLGPLRAKDIGLTLKHRSGTIIPAFVVALCIIAFKGIITALLRVYPADYGLETLLFQSIMPPLTQEILYSGLLLSLMIIALGGSKVNQKFDWKLGTVLAIIVTAFSHGIMFGLSFNTGFQFNIVAFSFPFLGKLLYAWLRLSTGSLVFPILAFSVSNIIVWLIRHLQF